MTGSVDLSPAHRAIVERILAEHVPLCEVRAFGSRATWTAKDYSDLDLAIVNQESLDRTILSRLNEAFEESNLPMRVDVVDWHAISDSFREVIQRDYAVLQQASEKGSVGSWSEVALGEVATVRSGFAFKSRDWTGDGIPVVKIANVKDGNLVLDSCSYVSRDTAARSDDFCLNAGDIVIAMTGYIGDVAMVRSKDLPAVLNQRVGRFTILDSDRLHDQFLFYVLRSENVREEIESLGYGSAQPNISPTLIQSVGIPLPPLSEQRAIAHVLGTLDDKIELNRRMSQTLEEMARALFKSWFVDFDPVRAKAALKRNALHHHAIPGAKSSLNGAAPADEWTVERAHTYLDSMDPQIVSLFPDRLVASDLGEIPEGWQVVKLGKDFHITMGQSPPGKTYNQAGDGMPLYQGRTDFGFRFPGYRIYCSAPTRLAKPGDTLVSVRAPVGDINMALDECCIGRGVAAVRHRTGSRSYTYYAMRSLRTNFELFEADGTVFGALNKRAFNSMPWVNTDDRFVATFDALCSPFDIRIETNEIENASLAAKREALLSELIAGEASIG